MSEIWTRRKPSPPETLTPRNFSPRNCTPTKILGGKSLCFQKALRMEIPQKSLISPEFRDLLTRNHGFREYLKIHHFRDIKGIQLSQKSWNPSRNQRFVKNSDICYQEINDFKNIWKFIISEISGKLNYPRNPEIQTVSGKSLSGKSFSGKRFSGESFSGKRFGDEFL